MCSSVVNSNVERVQLDRDAERYVKFNKSHSDSISTRDAESANIADEIRDLGYIKDIRDELGIMTVLLHSRTSSLPNHLPTRF